MASTFSGAMLFSAMLPTSKSANLTALAMLPAQLQAQFSRTPTGMSRLHQIESFNWAPHKMGAIHALQDFAKWQDTVNQMAENVDIILVLSHHGPWTLAERDRCRIRFRYRNHAMA